VKVYLAAVEEMAHLFACATAGVQNVLWSYYKFAGKRWTGASGNDDKARTVIRVIEEHGMDSMLDSGLFSLIFGRDSDTVWSEAELDAYAERYVSWVRAIGYGGPMVEVDAQMIVGTEATNRIRRRFDSMPNEVIFVWHLPEGMAGLERLVKERSWIALSVPELRKLAGRHRRSVSAMLTDLLGKIHDWGGGNPPKVHLLGNTDTTLIRTHLAYSCDSSSWMTNVRWGRAVAFNGREIVNMFKGSVRAPAYKEFCAEIEERFDVPGELDRWLKRYNCSLTNPWVAMMEVVGAHAYVRLQQDLDRTIQWAGERTKEIA